MGCSDIEEHSFSVEILLPLFHCCLLIQKLSQKLLKFHIHFFQCQQKSSFKKSRFAVFKKVLQDDNYKKLCFIDFIVCCHILFRVAYTAIHCILKVIILAINQYLVISVITIHIVLP